MALGDQADMTARLLRLLPAGWIPAIAPRMNAVLQGFAYAFSGIYSMLSFVKAQQRVSTATGSFLDLAAQDFFGVGGLPRFQYENDTAYRARIIYNLTAPRGTRIGMVKMLTQLTGRAPIIFQPNLPSDTGGVGTPGNFAAGGGLFAVGGAGSPGAGGVGTLTMPAQVFITVYRPTTGYAAYGYFGGAGSQANHAAGLGAGVAGGGSNTAGFATSGGHTYQFAAIDPASLPGEVTDAVIYEQIAAWMPAGATAWVQIL